MDNAIYNTLILLGIHQNVQEKLYKEICEYFPSRDEDIKVEQISQMKYLDAVFNESLRLMPVSPLIDRQLSADVTFGMILFITSFIIIIK